MTQRNIQKLYFIETHVFILLRLLRMNTLTTKIYTLTLFFHLQNL